MAAGLASAPLVCAFGLRGRASWLRRHRSSGLRRRRSSGLRRRSRERSLVRSRERSLLSRRSLDRSRARCLERSLLSRRGERRSRDLLRLERRRRLRSRSILPAPILPLFTVPCPPAHRRRALLAWQCCSGWCVQRRRVGRGACQSASPGARALCVLWENGSGVQQTHPAATTVRLELGARGYTGLGDGLIGCIVGI